MAFVINAKSLTVRVTSEGFKSIASSLGIR